MPTATAGSKVTASEQKLAVEISALVQPFIKGVPEIQSNETYQNYAEMAKTLKAQMAKVDEAYDDLIQAAHLQHKAILAKKKKYWQPLSDLFMAFQRRMGQFAAKKEQERLAQEQKLREQARQAEQDRLINEAAQLEQEGKVSEAVEVLQEAQTVEAPVVTVQKSIPQVSGVYQKANPWTFEIVDAQKIRDEYWIPDHDAIKAIVKAKGPAAETIIGQGSIKVKRETTTVIKG